MTDTLDTLRRLRACGPGLAWVKAQPDQSPQALWDACQDGSWLGWWLDKVSDPRGRLAAAACARLALPFAGEHEAVCRHAIETAERYARGEATAEELDAAWAAAWAAARAAWAAGQDPDAARREMLARCADAIRAVVPVCPEVPRD